MPLDNHLPVIDDRRYDDIVAEVRARIARYTPEWTPVWTDLNDTGPGVVLAQVFAWLSDMLLYRLGQVPQQNYIEFLKLVGIELMPAEPARVEVTLPVSDAFAEPFVRVPQFAQVSAEAESGPPIVFETERLLIALRAKLDRVQVDEGLRYLDRTHANDDLNVEYLPFGDFLNPDSALLLGFTEALPPVELNLAVIAPPLAVQSAPYVDCQSAETQAHPYAEIAWEYYHDGRWSPLTMMKDETQSLTHSGHIYLRLPANAEMHSTAIGDVIAEARYWIRARLVESYYTQPPRLLAIRTNTVAAIQAQTVRDEVLGGSSGQPNQRGFMLENTPVLRGSLVLAIDEGSGKEVWQEVDNFYASKPDSKHYKLNRTSGEVSFGDGQNGNIPASYAGNPNGNIVARQYRFGGGVRGNVAASRINTLLTPVQGIDQQGITNLQPAYGGRAEESFEEAKRRAPNMLQHRYRAVTKEDFEGIAKLTPGVKRAKALPLYHPGFPGVQVPGVMTVLIVPDGTGPNPTPGDGLLRSVCACLNDRRLLTTELYVIGPTYQQVYIEAEVIANPTADSVLLQQEIEESLLEFFHPLKGGQDGEGWPFGGDIYYSWVFQRISGVQGVARIERVTITLDDETAPDCADLPVADNVLLYSTEHAIRVNYAFDE